MSAPSPPPDNSMMIEMMKEQQQKEAQAAQDAKDLAHKQELAGLRTSARSAAGGSVANYFAGKGLDPTKYQGSIDQQLNDILAGISPTEENPGAAFSGAGQTIYDTLQTGARAQAQDALNRLFAPNFETSRVPLEIQDPYISSIEGEQFSNADKIIKNMLDRGVLTSSGYNTAEQDLRNQEAGVRSRLREIGTGLVTHEQQALGGIANRARQTAGSLQLGTDFDPNTYSTEADKSFNEFINTLGDQIRAAVPGQLFNTAGLAAIGGAGQGAGNTAYNPQAAQGIVDDSTATDTSKTTNPNSIF